MKASVVIPSRGGRQRLPRLLDALASQTHTDWEAIVVIDGDIDDSAAVVARYHHLPVRSIVLPDNRGRVTALNTGFEAATGEVLIRADDDFEPYPQHIAVHVAAHADEPCGVVGLPQNIGVDNAYMRAYGGHADQAFRDYAYSLGAEERWRLWGGNVSCTRETYDRVGGYSDAYRGYGWEDVDFGYRLHQLGLPIRLLKEAEVRHHLAAITTRIRANRAFASGEARAIFDGRHNGASTPSSPDGIWGSLVMGLSPLLTGQRTNAIGAALDFILPVLPRALGKRLVALLVEASAVAGYQMPRRTRHPRR